MNVRVVLLCLIGFVSGCARQTYEIDFNQAKGFEWDGKLRITKVERPRIGPFLTLHSDWQVERIELGSVDGSPASIDALGYREVPMATIALEAPAGLRVLGTITLWQGRTPNVVRESEPQESGDVKHTEDLTRLPEDDDPISVEDIAALMAKQPFVEHADELVLADWWNVALHFCDEVSLEFLVPDKDLRIAVRGRRSASGPDVVEVWTGDGLLKRYERQRIPGSVVETPVPWDEKGG